MTESGDFYHSDYNSRTKNRVGTHSVADEQLNQINEPSQSHPCPQFRHYTLGGHRKCMFRNLYNVSRDNVPPHPLITPAPRDTVALRQTGDSVGSFPRKDHAYALRLLRNAGRMAGWTDQTCTEPYHPIHHRYV